MRSIYRSFVEMLIRFFDSRFQLRKNEAIEELKLELFNQRREYSKLFDSYKEVVNPTRKEQEPEIDMSELKPIRQFQPSWSARARQYEEMSRNSSRPEVKVNAEQIAQLEKEVLADSHS